MLTRTKELLTVAPVLEPVTVAEAALHCRVTSPDAVESDYLATLIAAARRRIENVCWSSFVTQTWQYWWDRFDTRLYLPRPPLQALVSFQYAPPTTGGVAVYGDVDATLYELSAQNQLPYIRIQYLKTWPIPRGYRDDVTAVIRTGYGDNPSDVPEPIRQAIKLYVGLLYTNRGDEAFEMPKALWDLIEDYRFKEF